MENKKMEDGACARCGVSGMYGSHHWMHVIIKIAIALIIFWCGVQFGELKGMLRSSYGNYRMMGGYYGGEVNRTYGGPVMMYGGVQGVSQSVKTTATTTKK